MEVLVDTQVLVPLVACFISYQWQYSKAMRTLLSNEITLPAVT